MKLNQRVHLIDLKLLVGHDKTHQIWRLFVSSYLVLWISIHPYFFWLLMCIYFYKFSFLRIFLFSFSLIFFIKIIPHVHILHWWWNFSEFFRKASALFLKNNVVLSLIKWWRIYQMIFFRFLSLWLEVKSILYTYYNGLHF